MWISYACGLNNGYNSIIGSFLSPFPHVSFQRKSTMPRYPVVIFVHGGIIGISNISKHVDNKVRMIRFKIGFYWICSIPPIKSSFKILYLFSTYFNL